MGVGGIVLGSLAVCLLFGLVIEIKETKLRLWDILLEIFWCMEQLPL